MIGCKFLILGVVYKYKNEGLYCKDIVGNYWTICNSHQIFFNFLTSFYNILTFHDFYLLKTIVKEFGDKDLSYTVIHDFKTIFYQSSSTHTVFIYWRFSFDYKVININSIFQIPTKWVFIFFKSSFKWYINIL